MQFDLLIKHGEVVDPEGLAAGRRDVAIGDSRIAAVDVDIPAESAAEVIDASGLIVTPGLVDLHTHVFRGIGYWGVDADVVASTSGVTTWLDVGSCGALTLQGFREYVVNPASVQIFSFLNVSYLGLIGPDFELTNLNFCDVDIFERIANLNRDLVLGVKVRIGATTVGANGLEPMRRALEAAERCGLPLMVHIAEGPPEVDDVLRLMRPGDILTHCFTGLNMRLLDEKGEPRYEALRARDRGVVMDLGHGAGSLSFETAHALLANDFRPDTISTDIHQLSIGGPMYDLPTCMTKFLALGWSLREVVEATTIRPARILGLDEVGRIRPGCRADVALFRLEPGRHTLFDIDGDTVVADTAVRHELTIAAGRSLARKAPVPPAPWVEPGHVWPPVEAELVERQRYFAAAAGA
jgi:dihydroorotase